MWPSGEFCEEFTGVFLLYFPLPEDIWVCCLLYSGEGCAGLPLQSSTHPSPRPGFLCATVVSTEIAETVFQSPRNLLDPSLK